jgi:hypothetical protein
MQKLTKAIMLLLWAVSAALLYMPQGVSAGMSGNPLTSNYSPDPQVAIVGTNYYIFTTAFNGYSSPDLTHWKSEGQVFSLGQTTWATETPWAPGFAYKNGKCYFYFVGNYRTGVAISTNGALGPYSDALGHPLVDIGDSIDPCCFQDDNGDSYLLCGHGQIYIIKLNADMISYQATGDQIMSSAIIPQNYVEGPYMIKRNGIYYLMYSSGNWWDSSYNVQYCTASSPTGPFTYRGIILSTVSGSPHYGPGHNSVLQIPGRDEWYIVYHIWWQSGDGDRKMCMDHMYFNPDGTIQPVVMTETGVDAVPLSSAGTGSAAVPAKWEGRGIGGGGALFCPSFSPTDPNEVYASTDMGEIFHSTNQGAAWETYNCNYRQISGGTHAKVGYTANPAVRYVISGSTLCKTTDGGTSWFGLGNDSCRSLHTDVNGSSFLVADDTTMYLSTDGGSTFSSKYTRSAGLLVSGAFFDGTNVYAGITDGLLVSHNSGSTFTLAPSNGLSGEMCSFTGAKVGSVTRLMCMTLQPGLVGADVAPYRYFWNDVDPAKVFTMDVGGSWVQRLVMTQTGEGNHLNYIAMAQNNINVAYASGEAGYWQIVYKTTDGGGTWQQNMFPVKNQNIKSGWEADGGDQDYGWGGGSLGFTVAPNDCNKVMISDMGFCHMSVDGGANWSACYVDPASQNAENQYVTRGKSYKSSGIDQTTAWSIAWADSNNMFVAFTDISGLRSIDGGQTFSFNYSGHYENTMYHVFKHTDGKLYACTSDIHDMYMNWRLSDSPIDSGGGRVLMSTDKGATWTALWNAGHPVVWLEPDWRDDKRMYACVAHSALGGIYVCDDITAATTSWRRLAAPPRTMGHPQMVKILKDGSLVCSYSARYAGGFTTSAGVFISSDGGSNWEDRTAAEMVWYTREFTIDPNDTNQNIWYVGVSSGWGGGANGRGGLYKTLDRGQHWTRLFEVGDLMSIAFNPNNPAEMWVCGGGLWYSHNADAANPMISKVYSYPFYSPTRLFYNPYNSDEIWLTSPGNGLRVGHPKSDAQAAGTISVSPSTVSVGPGGLQAFSATVVDQYGYPMVIQPTITWSVSSGGGTISGSGVLMASTTTGVVTVTASVGGRSGSASVTISASVPVPSPYTGTAQTLPGTVQAEDFDNGGEGIAYHDADTGNDGGAYRATDVDIGGSPGNYKIGWTATGEWLIYTVNVLTGGSYSVDAQVAVAGGGAGGTFHIECDGVNVTGPMTVPETGGWTTFATVTATGLNMSTGRHIMRLVFDSYGPTYYICDFDSMRFYLPNGPNQPPTVSIVSPSEGAQFRVPASVSITANAADSDGINKVEFFQGTTPIGTVTSSPYTFIWNNPSAGNYALRAKATDTVGSIATSAVVNIVVKPPNVAPTVSITSPTNGTRVTAGSTVTITTDAADSDGTVARVQFYAASNLIATMTSAPFNFVWSNVWAGVYNLKAIAIDDYGMSVTSVGVTLNVIGAVQTNGTGTGVIAQYYNGTDLTNLTTTRTETNLYFTWDYGAPDALVNPDLFSARWTGKIQPRFSETYTFYVTRDNGARLWVNNQLICDGWTGDWDVTDSGTIALQAGQFYDIKEEYFENGGGAYVHTEWQSLNQPREPIPQCQLYTAAPPSTVSTPYSGTAAAIPGTIQCEEYDNGAEGVAYHDVTTGNLGGLFRTNDVDIYNAGDTGNGYRVGNINAGEWMKYTVNVANGGNYTLETRVAYGGAGNGGSFHLECDGVNLTGSITLPNTGSYSTWQTITNSGVNVTAGTHILKLVVDVAGGVGWAADFNWFKLSAVASIPNAGWWKLDETNGTVAADSSGSGHNGTVSGGAAWQPTGGHSDGAISLNGTGAMIDTGLKASNFGIGGSNPRTVCLWAYTRSFNNGAVFDMGSYANDSHFSLRTMGSNNCWRMNLWAADTDFTCDSLNKWVHFAVVYDGTNVTVYGGGVAITNVTVALTTGDDLNVAFGKVFGDYYNGILDDIRIYGRALSQSEIQAIVAVGSGAVDTDGDGIADSWETLYFGSPTGCNPNEDSDGDGMSNLQEFILGTDPTNAHDVLRATIGRNASGDGVVSFSSFSSAGSIYGGKSRYYTLESTTNMMSTNWQAVAGCSNLPGTDSVVSRTNVNVGVKSTFYRVRCRLQ